jgi:hypothetical protein
LQFDTALEPHGSKGPDLSVSRNNQSACVEVKRLRYPAKGDALNTGNGDETELVQYGNPERAVKKIEDELLAKFRLPLVSFSIAMVEPVTSVGGMVNTAPRALIRS